jgi:pimeloyl-ACP methyl ester carboxylesterase
MTQPTIDTLKAPGASLHYEVRGKGPVLLFIPGGNGDAGPFEQVANALADRYTVMIYDRRGFSRSPLDAPVDDRLRLETDSADVIRLIDRLTEGPAHVFGSSSGAIVALDVITRYPERIRTLIAHEPPLVALLPDAEKQLKFAQDVYATYRRSGIEQAMEEFRAGIGLQTPSRPPPGAKLPPQVLEMMSRVHKNLLFWIEHELRQYVRVVPDFDRLKAVSGRIVLAGGRESRELLPYRPNLVLAERLGLEVVDFPGDHIGYAFHPAEFAAQLSQVMGG